MGVKCHTGTQSKEVKMRRRTMPATSVLTAAASAKHPSKLWCSERRALVTISATDACSRSRDEGRAVSEARGRKELSTGLQKSMPL